MRYTWFHPGAPGWFWFRSSCWLLFAAEVVEVINDEGATTLKVPMRCDVEEGTYHFMSRRVTR